MKRVILAIGCLVSAAGGCAGEEDVGQGELELLGGQIDPGHKFSVGICVGALTADGSCPVPGTPGTVRCSGTLVGPNLVLTARHCIEELAPGSPEFCSGQFTGVRINPQMRITTSDTVLRARTWHSVASVFTPPGNNICNDDLALFLLQTRVTDAEPVGADLRRDVVRFPPAAVALVGRGAIVEQYDPATFERIAFDNGGILRRILQNIPFVCAPEKTGDCTLVDYWSAPPTFSPPAGLFAYGPSGAVGDSGAGVFDQAQFSVGRYFAIGVNTLSTLAADGNSSGSQAVRLDQHAPLIRRAAQAAAFMGGYQVPVWAR